MAHLDANLYAGRLAEETRKDRDSTKVRDRDRHKNMAH